MKKTSISHTKVSLCLLFVVIAAGVFLHKSSGGAWHTRMDPFVAAATDEVGGIQIESPAPASKRRSGASPILNPRHREATAYRSAGRAPGSRLGVAVGQPNRTTYGRWNRTVHDALYADDPEERQYALSELPLLESQSLAVRFVCLAALEDAVDDVRLHAVLALDDLKDPSVYPFLERLSLGDPAREVRAAARDVMRSLERHRRN